MMKNKFIIFLLFNLIFWGGTWHKCLAQSEMDLLLEEKRNEGSSKDENLEGLSFTDIITGKAKEKPKEEVKIDANANANESWLKSLFKHGKKELIGNKEQNKESDEVIKPSNITQKSNAAYFDISGVKLRMKPSEVEDILTRQGYRKIAETLEIPNFIEWRSEELCKLNGVVGFERLNACATRIAQEHGYQFVERQIFNKYLTKETIEVNFTSSFTDNMSYRVHYKSNIQMSDSKASKNIYINNIKVFDFWRRIDLKYGKPDNTTEVKWGLGGKKPYLRASTGEIELMDPLLSGLDSSRMFNEDSRLANTEYYTF